MSVSWETREALDRTIRLCQGVIFEPKAITDDAIVGLLMSTRVSLVADERNLESAACQTAVVALARLVLGYGCSLRLCMPPAPVVGQQPPLTGRELRAGLVDLAADVVPGTMAEVSTSTAAEDIVFVFGDTQWNGSSELAWRVTSEPGEGVISRSSQGAKPFADESPLGALAAAALASAEPFKAAIRRSNVPQRIPEQAAAAASARLRVAPPDVEKGVVNVGFVDCVSGGAITNAFLFALLRFPSITGTIRVFEPQRGELSNVNRYVLMRMSTSSWPKVDMLRQWSTPSFAIEGTPTRVTDETVAQLARGQVVVGVDHVPTRWLVQRQQPAWLAIGGTDDFLVQVSEHGGAGGCAGCAYFANIDAPAPFIPTISFVSFWAGLLLAARTVRRAASGVASSSEQSVELTPLRLDNPIAARVYAVPRREDCPVRCMVGLSQE